MMTVPKEVVKKIIDSLPEDTTYEEILRELAFDKMIGQGLDDVENGKVISNQEMENIIAQW
jgi:predicted transcriptional regulator